MNKTIQERFWEKVVKQKSGCWEWTGSRSHGYGYILYDKKVRRAHRVKSLEKRRTAGAGK